MKLSPEQLEKLIHETLRPLPDRRAPHTLEARVFAALAERAALPWWRQPYAEWPLAVRCGFLVISGGLMKLALMAGIWVMVDFNTMQSTSAFAAPLSWLQQTQAVFGGIGNFCSMLIRSIPPLWFYGGLAIFASLYVALFGLGAAAYRTLCAGPRAE